MVLNKDVLRTLWHSPADINSG